MRDLSNSPPRGILSLPWHSPCIADRDVGRDNNFNLIRLLAAMGVLVSHAYPISLGAGTAEPLERLLHGISLGRVCVYIFFSISGFFIARSFAKRGEIGSFLRARTLRLVPALAVVLCLTVLVMGPLVTSAPAVVYWQAVPSYWVHNFTLFALSYTLPGVFAHNPFGPAINGSLWSLSYEVTCYLGVLVCGVLGLLRRYDRFALVVLAFIIFYVLAAAQSLNYRLELLANLGLPFGIGMIFWVARGAVPLSLPLSAFLVLAAVVAWFTPLFTPIFILALAYAVFLLGYARIPLLAGVARRNDYSYGLYVYAFPLQQLIALAGVTTPLVNILLALPATFVCAALSWHLVEARALRLRWPTEVAKETTG